MCVFAGLCALQVSVRNLYTIPSLHQIIVIFRDTVPHVPTNELSWPYVFKLITNTTGRR